MKKTTTMPRRRRSPSVARRARVPVGGDLPRTATRRATTLLALLAVALTPTPALATVPSAEPVPTSRVEARNQERQGQPVEMRRYTVRRGNQDTAYLLAQALCQETRYNRPDPGNVRCDVEAQDASLIFIATADLHERLAAELAEIDMPSHTQRFHIAVLEATDQASMPDDLHEGAVAALEDLRSFLPYNGFRTLANGWLETAGEGRTSLPGPGNFELELVFEGDPERGETLMVDHFRLTAIPLTPEEIRAYERNAETPPRRIVLQNNFAIDIGETKVLGTSKINGDGEALVVLLTALE